MKSSLCAFADWFPEVVGQELEEGRELGHQFWETGWTDRMLFQLKRLRDPRIIVQHSPERTTNADMDWYFVSPHGGGCLRLILQAKVLHYARPGRPLRYGELAYPKHSGEQAGRLTNFARSESKAGSQTYPLYIFYNPETAPVWSGRMCCAPGVSLASGYRVREHLLKERRASRRAGRGDRVPPHALELSAIRDLMVCLHKIFCTDVMAIPDPHEVARALADTDRAIGRATGSRLRPPQPKAAESIPRDIAHLVDRALAGSLPIDSEDDVQLERPRVTFIAGEGSPDHVSTFMRR